MTRIYRYTESGVSGSISGTSPFPFGTSRSRVTTRTGLYDEIVLALVAAGWTQYNIATRDDVWESTGESGLEKIYIRTKYLVPGTPTTQNAFNFYVGTKLDGSNNLLGQIGTTSSTNTFDGWITSADATFDFQILATKDYIWCNARIVATSPSDLHLSFFLGQLDRANIVQSTNMILATNATAGSNVVLDVTGYNPITLGYRPGDWIQIVSIATADAARAQTVSISSLTSTSITVQSLAASYTAGALIAASPMPTVRYVGKNIGPGTVAQWTSPLAFDPSSTTDIVGGSGASITTINYVTGSSITDSADHGTGTTPDKRTKRFGCRSFILQTTNAALGRVPGAYVYPGSMTFFPHDTGTWNRVSPSQRFVGARFVNTGGSNYMLGPMP